MADRITASGRPVYRDLSGETLRWHLTVVGAAALGFLGTFIALDHEIHTFKNAILPLLAMLLVYLFLTSLNTWWVARATAKLGQREPSVAVRAAQRLPGRVLSACGGLAFGALAALLYIRSVAN